jgi:hypothetical protein
VRGGAVAAQRKAPAADVADRTVPRRNATHRLNKRAQQHFNVLQTACQNAVKEIDSIGERITAKNTSAVKKQRTKPKLQAPLPPL